MADLDRKVKKAKRDLVRKPFRSLVGVVGAISFGILTGLVTQDTATLAKTIGLVKFGSDLIQDTMALGDKENPISNDKFYFLWKLQKKTK